MGAAQLVEHATKLREDGDDRAAEAKLKTALKVSPNSGWAAMKYGEFLYDAGKFKKAAKYLRDALHEAPLWPDVHYLLGQIAVERGRHAVAADHFRVLVN